MNNRTKLRHDVVGQVATLCLIAEVAIGDNPSMKEFGDRAENIKCKVLKNIEEIINKISDEDVALLLENMDKHRTED